MRIASITTIAATVCAALLLPFAALAHEHTALNGTWTLVRDKSDFGGQPAIESGTVNIDERQGNISVARSFVYHGAAGTYFYRDLADSRNSATIHGGAELKSKARWEHDVLKVTTNQSGVITLETYSLAPDGTMLVRVDRPGSAPFTLVFERK